MCASAIVVDGDRSEKGRLPPGNGEAGKKILSSFTPWGVSFGLGYFVVITKTPVQSGGGGFNWYRLARCS
jgi:hypothetical protein